MAITNWTARDRKSSKWISQSGIQGHSAFNTARETLQSTQQQCGALWPPCQIRFLDANFANEHKSGLGVFEWV
jgi:hypothetical protein